MTKNEAFDTIFHSVYSTCYEAASMAIEASDDTIPSHEALENMGSSCGLSEDQAWHFAERILGGEQPDWPLLFDRDAEGERELQRLTALHPMTEVQRRWLKTLWNNPRIRLFDVQATGLEQVQPLFDWKLIRYYDRFTDGDPFEDEAYIRHFRTVLRAVCEHRNLRVVYENRNGVLGENRISPVAMEYSPLNDSFRVVAYRAGKEEPRFMNIARIRSCKLLDAEYDPAQYSVEKSENATEMTEIVCILTDTMNTLDRAMRQLSYMKKETIKLDEKRYQLKLFCRREDETETLLRLMEFGRWVEIIQPTYLRDELMARISRQLKRGL